MLSSCIYPPQPVFAVACLGDPFPLGELAVTGGVFGFGEVSELFLWNSQQQARGSVQGQG